jgi:hypothetical protein
MTSLESAIAWLTALLSGSLVTVLAMLAVATAGFELLSGRLALRRGGMVILGSFILLGAATIARGLIGLVGSPPAIAPPATETAIRELPAITPESTPVLPPPAVTRSNPFDPYVGKKPTY